MLILIANALALLAPGLRGLAFFGRSCQVLSWLTSSSKV